MANDLNVEALKGAGMNDVEIGKLLDARASEAWNELTEGFAEKAEVKRFKSWLSKQQFGIKVTFTLPSPSGEVAHHVSKPGSKSNTTGNGRNGKQVKTAQGVYDSFVKASIAHGLVSEEEVKSNVNYRLVLERAKVDFEVIEKAA